LVLVLCLVFISGCTYENKFAKKYQQLNADLQAGLISKEQYEMEYLRTMELEKLNRQMVIKTITDFQNSCNSYTKTQQSIYEKYNAPGTINNPYYIKVR